jgi:hypothetical protein
MNLSSVFSEPENVSHATAVKDNPPPAPAPTYYDTLSLFAGGLLCAASAATTTVRNVATTAHSSISNIDWYQVSENIEFARDVTYASIPPTLVTHVPKIIRTQFPSRVSFQNRHSFEERLNMAQQIIKAYPHCIPVVVEKSSWSKLETLSKTKFLVPHGMTNSIFHWNIRKLLKFESHQAVFLCSNGIILTGPATSMMEQYKIFKDSDGFLYLQYHEENVFG